MGTFPVAFEDTRPLYDESSECPLSFFRNMMKREPTYNNVKALLERFLSSSYTLDSHGDCGYGTDVDIGRVDGSVTNLFDGVKFLSSTFSNSSDDVHFSHGLKRLLVWFHDYEHNYNNDEHDRNERNGVPEPLLEMYDTPICILDNFETIP